MSNTVRIENWTDSDREILFESIRGDRKRTKKSIHINDTLIERFGKLHPKRANNTHTGVSLSDAVNKGLLLYLKLYEEENQEDIEPQARHGE